MKKDQSHQHLLLLRTSCPTVMSADMSSYTKAMSGVSSVCLVGGFPELQMKMRSVLRLEMEAVRFLKEEPHKMDSMLKRVKALTEALSGLRRCSITSLSYVTVTFGRRITLTALYQQVCFRVNNPSQTSPGGASKDPGNRSGFPEDPEPPELPQTPASVLGQTSSHTLSLRWSG